MALFVPRTVERDDEQLNVLIADFHDDLGPDGWRLGTLLRDDRVPSITSFRAA
jgi:hypothetical protein